MINNEIFNLLGMAFPVFSTLPEELREVLKTSAQVMTVPEGMDLFDDGSPCRAFPLLLKGSLRVTKASVEGREMLLYRITPGQLCLLTSCCLLGRASYPARGVAESESTLVLLDGGIFHRLLAQYEPFRLLVFGLFAERITELMQLVEAVAFGRLDQRLAALLVSRGAVVNASHQNLADELGSVRVVVSRILRSFEEKHWVELGREQIKVLKPDELKAMAHENL